MFLVPHSNYALRTVGAFLALVSGRFEVESDGGLLLLRLLLLPFDLLSFLHLRAGKIRSPSRHLRSKNIFGDQITASGGQFGD